MQVDIRRFDSKNFKAYTKFELIMIADILGMELSSSFVSKDRDTIATLVFDELPLTMVINININITKVEKQNPTPTLPNEILNEIVGYMDIETMGRFSQCSKVCQSLTQPILTKIKKNFDIDVSLDEIKVGTVLVHKLQSSYNRGFVFHHFYQVKNITPQKSLRLIPLMKENLAREITSRGKCSKCTVSPMRLNNGDFIHAIVEGSVGVKKPAILSKKFDKYEKNNRTWYFNYFLYDPSKEYKDIYHPHM